MGGGDTVKVKWNDNTEVYKHLTTNWLPTGLQLHYQQLICNQTVPKQMFTAMYFIFLLFTSMNFAMNKSFQKHANTPGELEFEGYGFLQIMPEH